MRINAPCENQSGFLHACRYAGVTDQLGEGRGFDGLLRAAQNPNIDGGCRFFLDIVVYRRTLLTQEILDYQCEIVGVAAG